MDKVEAKQYEKKLINIWNSLIDLLPREVKQERHIELQRLGAEYCKTYNELLDKKVEESK